MNSQELLLAVLAGETPERAVFCPNIWQWFEYQKLHGLVPAEFQGFSTQLEVLKYMEVDIFSRNLLTDVRRSWIGGHAEFKYTDVEVTEQVEGNRRKITYRTPEGPLTETLFFDEKGCTLVQEEYLFKDFSTEYPAWKALFEDRRFSFDAGSYEDLVKKVGQDGLVIVGEFTCPLKQLHWNARADSSIYLLFDHEKEMIELMEIYEAKVLEFCTELVNSHGVKVVMTMDNLDSMFYTPDQFEKYCAPFFRRISRVCHDAGAYFFSHACGRQREILDQVVECGIDGLEGIAFPPLGDIDLWEARLAGEKFIVNGGLSAVQLEGPVTRTQAEDYVEKLFLKMRPFHRFTFAMSCNTSILTAWDTLRYYRDAWHKYAQM
ncbi:MAG: uroporphyrinogen decarboxylase family protein [Gemmatimonadota bacterium]|nr:uroporphyrinogen decarboxylase family protein [Gemmatimonadota bacterium]